MFRARCLTVDDECDARALLSRVGVHEKGIDIMAGKAVHFDILVEDVPNVIANILKQEMLSIGGDAAVRKDAVYGGANEHTDVVLMGTEKHMRVLASKLDEQPLGLHDIGNEVVRTMQRFMGAPKPISIGKVKFDWGARTYIMGILNVTPDSFSGDGITDLGSAVARAKKMVEEGADIIDVGGESTRPRAEPVSLDEEKMRVLPVVEKLASELEGNAVISVDTYKPEVAKEALAMGAHIVNDITGLSEPAMLNVALEAHAPVVVMHMQGTPRNMQASPRYGDVVREIFDFLSERVENAVSKKMPREQLWVDPGIGFGKTVEHNLTLIRRLREFRSIGCPVLIGMSRKSFLGKAAGLQEGDRLEGSLASVALAIANGADIVRVHDVKESARVAKVCDAVVRARLR